MQKLVKNWYIFIIIVVLSLLLAVVLAKIMLSKPLKEHHTMTDQFIEQFMRNENGTLATYLRDAASTDPDIVSGREALSESLGLWMQFAVLAQDRPEVDKSVGHLNTYFMAPEGYVRWKLQADGQSKVSTNALGDDLRIIKALLDAHEIWDNPGYMKLAEQISRTLQDSVTVNDYFVDFHDFEHGQSPDRLSLVYVDISAMQAMVDHGLLTPHNYNLHKKLLLDMPNDGVFYPKDVLVTTGKYRYDDSVNLIDQLITGMHLAELKTPEPLISFLKEEFRSKGTLYGRYHRINRTPDVSYESPSVYGLAILLSLKTGDTVWAEQLYSRMMMFRDGDPAYPGGYVSGGNTHMFDNLFPLLAEKTLESHNPSQK
ncbi:glycosyl hydrolase [Paenibacillus lemnae]|uniref:Glycosyl hydrolase n=1 Tax=Paenibacillus lemnae TaxID=1330551 RepID=A0A848M3G6_PAELE|nr:glycosyl hydrolase [Paenibacillus lemnae]NMO94383.1 glycosyl hydrolase [Paenibacillus lemnae]